MQLFPAIYTKTPTRMSGLRGYVTASFGRALEWHSRGQRFDPAYLHQKRSQKWLVFARKQAISLKKVQTDFSRVGAYKQSSMSVPMFFRQTNGTPIKNT